MNNSSEFIREIGTPAMLAALEANAGEEMACFGRGLARAEFHDDAEMTWFITQRRYLNGVVRTHLVQQDASYVDTRIRELCAYFATQKVSMNWAISPVTTPYNMASRLLANGFTYRTDDLWMALDLHNTNSSTMPPPATFIITECMTEKDLLIWRNVNARGFDNFEEGAQTYYENYHTLGFGNGQPWHHYLVWLDHEAVAAASLLLHAGIAGIYGVSTVSEARRKGIGYALTHHLLQEARSFGYHIAILAPSKMGINMYRRLGFQNCCHLHHYSWTPRT